MPGGKNIGAHKKVDIANSIARVVALSCKIGYHQVTYFHSSKTAISTAPTSDFGLKPVHLSHETERNLRKNGCL